MTDRPDWSHSLRSERYNTEYERGYGIPDRMGLQLSIEWSLLLRIARCDSYGWCYSDRTNEKGGFHCDDFDIRPFDYNIEDGSEPPNFEFRPGGLRMWWYKYPWRAADMNMPLTLKQILDVFALCIDSLRFGFGIEGTSVEDILEMYPRTKVDVPEYLEERFQRAMVGMKSGADDTGHTYCSAQYRWGHQYADDGSDDASWWISSGIDGYECSRNHSRRQQLGERSA